MSYEKMKGMLERTPFTPFHVHLRNGQSLQVHHPEFVFLFKTYLEIGVPLGDPRSRAVERAEHVSLLHIARIEDLSVTA